MKRVFALSAATLLATLSFSAFPCVSASANSAAPYWSGTTANGNTFQATGDCPLEVKSEKLTFNLQEFPSVSQSLDEYTGKVTAEYTFYNPSDYTINSKMLFPFGRTPSYGYPYKEQNGLDNPQRYGVAVNGEVVEKEVRYTYMHYYEQKKPFDADKELKKYAEGYMEYSFFAPATPVYQYSFDLVGDKYAYFQDYTYVHILAPLDYQKTAIVNPKGVTLATYSLEDNNFAEMTVKKDYCELPQKIQFYVVGQDVDFTWEICEFGKKTTVEWETLYTITKNELTFNDLISPLFKEDSPIPYKDFYNAIMYEIFHYYDYVTEDVGFYFDSTKESYYQKSVGFNLSHISPSLSPEDWMQWYEYDMVVPPKSTVTNAVTAPIYPTINNHDGYMRVKSYDYTYLLSPAKTWSNFENLEIIINTPYMLTSDCLGGFEKTETGYRLFLETLPEGELTFRLRNPNEKKYVARGCYLTVSSVPMIAVCGVVAMLLKKKRK